MAPTTAGRSCSFSGFGWRSATQERFAFDERERRLSGKREASMRSPLHRDLVGRGPGLEAASGPPLLGDPLLYAVALIASAVCAPVFRYVLWLGDEGVLLHGAARILGGEVLYRDFFEVLPPGSFLIITAWMKLFGAGFASVRVLAVGVIAVIAALLYAAARLSSDNRPLAALLSIAWAVRVPWENSHHWFTTAASMAAAVGLLLALAGPRRCGPGRRLPAPRHCPPQLHRAARLPALRARRDGSARPSGAPRPYRRGRALDRPVPRTCRLRAQVEDGRRHRSPARGANGARAHGAAPKSLDRRLRSARGPDRPHPPRRRLLFLPLRPDASLPHGTPSRCGPRRDDTGVYDDGAVPRNLRARPQRGSMAGHRAQLDRPD